MKQEAFVLVGYCSNAFHIVGVFLNLKDAEDRADVGNRMSEHLLYRVEKVEFMT